MKRLGKYEDEFTVKESVLKGPFKYIYFRL